jgi:hypothetical protein
MLAPNQLQFLHFKHETTSGENPKKKKKKKKKKQKQKPQQKTWFQKFRTSITRSQDSLSLSLALALCPLK